MVYGYSVLWSLKYWLLKFAMILRYVMRKKISDEVNYIEIKPALLLGRANILKLSSPSLGHFYKKIKIAQIKMQQVVWNLIMLQLHVFPGFLWLFQKTRRKSVHMKQTDDFMYFWENRRWFWSREMNTRPQKGRWGSWYQQLDPHRNTW